MNLGNFEFSWAKLQIINSNLCTPSDISNLSDLEVSSHSSSCRSSLTSSRQQLLLFLVVFWKSFSWTLFSNQKLWNPFIIERERVILGSTHFQMCCFFSSLFFFSLLPSFWNWDMWIWKLWKSEIHI